MDAKDEIIKKYFNLKEIIKVKLTRKAGIPIFIIGISSIVEKMYEIPLEYKGYKINIEKL